MQRIRIATRKSPLAIWQAEHIAMELHHLWPGVTTELVPISTSGDKFLQQPLQEVGGKGLFVKELEDALLQDRADLAVHSMKDVPSEQPQGLQVGIIPPRENPFDAFISPLYDKLSELPQGAKVGTVSLRRTAQLLAVRPDLQILPLRGNIQTRLEKLDRGEFDAIILAQAGLRRLGLQERIQEKLFPPTMLPAPGQGALGLEYREDDDKLKRLLLPLHCQKSAEAVFCERFINAQLGGSCHAPIAIYACVQPNEEMQVHAQVLSKDGKTVLHAEASGWHEDWQIQAESCVESLLAQGALALLQQDS